MRVDQRVGVQKHRPAGYAEYRRRMLPTLRAFGGQFLVDVCEVFKALKEPFNTYADFCCSPAYRVVHGEFFVLSVGAVSALSASEVCL